MFKSTPLRCEVRLVVFILYIIHLVSFVGGVLVFCCNSLIYLNQSTPPYGVSLNSMTVGSTMFPLGNNFDFYDRRKHKQTMAFFFFQEFGKCFTIQETLSIILH